MKLKKTLICIVLAASLSASALAAAVPFSDLDSISEKDKILALQEKGIINGMGGDLFDPQGNLTAAQAVKLIVKTTGINIDNIRFIKAPQVTDYFKNGHDGAWYADSLIIAAMNDIGLPKDLDPDSKINREQFLYYLVSAIEKRYNIPTIKMYIQITDEDQITVTYSGAIQRALLYGLTTLDASGNFSPKADITRAQAAAMIFNAVELLKDRPLAEAENSTN